MLKRLSVSAVVPFATALCFFVMSAHASALTRTRVPVATRAKPAVATATVLSEAHPALTKTAAKIRVVKTKTAVSGVNPPRRLSIPRLKIDAPVLDVGLLKAGRMDVPPDGKKLGWYTLGAKPGEVGNAVIAGHLDTAKGPGAFWELNKSKVGDAIDIYDEQGAKQEFVVRKTALYDMREPQPVTEIFGPAKTRSLNLITCAGTWDRAMSHYDKRFVVYAEAVESTVKIAGQ